LKLLVGKPQLSPAATVEE